MHREPSRVPCPICGASHFKEIKKFPDGVIVGRCDECGTTYTPFMHATPEGLFTDSDEKILRYVYAPILEKRVKHFRHGTFASYVDVIKRYAPGKKHLDVGCAHGFFPAASREAGFEVTGVEPGPRMAKFAKNILDLNVHEGVLSAVDLGAG